MYAKYYMHVCLTRMVVFHIFHKNSKHHEQILNTAKLSQTNMYRDQFRRVSRHGRHLQDGRKKAAKPFLPTGLNL